MFESWDAVIFDLDGTLVHLAVDWEQVTRDATTELARLGHREVNADLWDILNYAEAAGLGAQIESVIAEHEVAGARTGVRLPLADHLPHITSPIGVCSLNSQVACRVALDVIGLSEHVDVVVGRDTVDAWKPDPKPLKAAIQTLGANPHQTIFVGDSERDAVTAERAGIPFMYAEDTTHPTDIT